MKFKILFRACALLLLFSVLLAFAGCADRTARPSLHANKVVAKAGDVKIRYDEYYYLAMTYIRQLKAIHGEDALSDPALREELEQFLLENLRNEKHALMAVGSTYGIRFDRGVVKDNVQMEIDQLIGEDRDAFLIELSNNYMTERYLRLSLAVEEQYMSAAIVDKMVEKGDISVSDEHVLELLGNEKNFIRIRKVVISSTYSGGAEKAEKRAQELRAMVEAATTPEARNDAMLEAISFSLDFTDMTGKGQYFTRGELKKELESAFDLELYGVSEVIELEGDYCFVMRLPVEDGYLTENMSELKKNVGYIYLNEAVEKWLEENPLELTKFGRSLDPTNLEQIDPEGGESIFIAGWVGGGLLVLVVGVWVGRVCLLSRRLKGKKDPKRVKKMKH